MNKVILRSLRIFTALSCFLMLFTQCKDVKVKGVENRGRIADSAMVVSAR